MTYRVWHKSHWAVVERRKMTPISVHREKKKGENYTQRRKGAEEERHDAPPPSQ